MIWGVFSGLSSAIHVAPCDGEWIGPPHELSVGCVCQPKVIWNEVELKPIVVHEELSG